MADAVANDPMDVEEFTMNIHALPHDIWHEMLSMLTEGLFPPARIGAWETFVGSTRRVVFAQLRRRFKPVLALHCTCRALRHHPVLPSVADMGRLVWRAFETGRFMPGAIDKLVTRSVDALLHEHKDNPTVMALLGRYVLNATPALPSCKVASRHVMWHECLRLKPEEQVALLGRRFSRNRPPPLLTELVAHAKALRALRATTEKNNDDDEKAPLGVPALILLPRRQLTVPEECPREPPPLGRAQWRVEEMLYDAFALDELTLSPGYFQPQTPDGRFVGPNDLHLVRHVTKTHSALASVAKWPRGKVKRWVRNSNRILMRQEKTKRCFKDRLRRRCGALRAAGPPQ